MATAIHIEIDALFLLILCVIAWQLTHSVSKQMNRLLFRYVVFGNMAILILDILWMLIEGQTFPGAIPLNRVINAVYLGSVVVMAGIWYLYVLESLGYKLTKKLVTCVMTPGLIFVILNLISIKTGWIFYISEDNHYLRGPLFFLQSGIALLSLFASLIHLLVFYFKPQTKIPKTNIRKLLSFYIVPFVGSILALPFSGMPGTWTCAAVSVILMYMDEQENAISRDSLTGLNNRKTLEGTFNAYIHQVSEVKNLYLFIMDLNNFKGINDTYGHPVGDQALVDAAHIITQSLSGMQGLVVRYGGDEFVVLTFFYGDPNAINYAKRVKEDFATWNREHKNPYTLATSIGFSRYQEGQQLKDLLKKADEALYLDKKNK